MSLRSKFVVVALASASLPLGVTGVWLARSAAGSGERLLRDQLDQLLERTAAAVDESWVYRQSDLLVLSTNLPVADALDDPTTVRDQVALGFLGDAYPAMSPGLAAFEIRDLRGNVRWSLDSLDPSGDETGSTSLATPTSRALDLELPIVHPVHGDLVGTLQAYVRINSLVPPGIELAGPQDAVVTVVDRRTGRALLATPFSIDLMRSGRFVWRDGLWLAASRALAGPEIDVLVAAPADPYTRPFRTAARNGMLALVGVLGVGAAVVSLLTTRVTRSLSNLATAAQAVSLGDLDRTVVEAGDDEVARLSRSFNRMTASLRATLRRLSEQETLATLGRFASFLAHEVRNPLSALKLDLQGLEERVDTPEAKAAVERSLAAIERVDLAVDGARRLVRSGGIDRVPVQVGPLLGTALEHVGPAIGAGVDLRTQLDAAAGSWVRGDAAALEQLVLNLVSNALEALKDGVGTVEVIVEIEEGDVVISVVDDGVGMDVSVSDRAFDPFFTTKSAGTGFGLAFCDRVVAAHGGSIRLRSEAGSGTVAEVRLPRMEAAPACNGPRGSA